MQRNPDQQSPSPTLTTLSTLSALGTISLLLHLSFAQNPFPLSLLLFAMASEEAAPVLSEQQLLTLATCFNDAIYKDPDGPGHNFFDIDWSNLQPVVSASAEYTRSGRPLLRQSFVEVSHLFSSLSAGFSSYSFLLPFFALSIDIHHHIW